MIVFYTFATMKRTLLIVFGVLLAMVACHTPTREAQRMLICAEQMLDTLPDSTIRLIDSVKQIEVNLSEGQRMNMALLYTLALYKGGNTDLDWAAKNTPLELEQAVAYFDKRKDYEKATQAALYTGYMFEILNEVEKAAHYLKEAERLGTLAGDTLFVAKAQHRYAYIVFYKDQTTFNNGGLQEGLSILEKAETGYRSDDYYRRSKLTTLKGTYLFRLGDPEAAEDCLKKAIDLAYLVNSDDAKSYALYNYALVSRLQEKYDRAIDTLKRIYNVNDKFDPDVIYELTNIYYTIEESDSAARYCQLLTDFLSTPEAEAGESFKEGFLMKCYNVLSYFNERQGNMELALNYARTREKLYYKLVGKEVQESTYRIQKQYDYEVLQNKMNKEITRKQRVITLVTMIAALVLAALAISQIRLARRKKQMTENQAKLFHYMLNNKHLEQKYEGSEKTAQNYAKMLTEAWTKEETTMQKLAVLLNNKGDKAMLDDLKHTVFGKETPWEAMMEVVDRIYPGLRETIWQKYPDLTEDEEKDFILSYFNISRQDEANLLGISVSVVDKLRNKTRKKTCKNSDFSEKSSD